MSGRISFEHPSQKVSTSPLLLPPPSVVMKPQSCKSKGRRLQQKVARSILDKFQHLGDGDVVSTSMGAGGEDVRMSPLARASLPLSIECKCVEKINVWACLDQARANTPSGGDVTPCLVFSRNNAPTYAVVPWDVLLELYGRIDSKADGIPPRLADLLSQLTQFAPKD